MTINSYRFRDMHTGFRLSHRTNYFCRHTCTQLTSARLTFFHRLWASEATMHVIELSFLFSSNTLLLDLPCQEFAKGEFATFYHALFLAPCVSTQTSRLSISISRHQLPGERTLTFPDTWVVVCESLIVNAFLT